VGGSVMSPLFGGIIGDPRAVTHSLVLINDTEIIKYTH
jgi:hypothetical protein